MSNNKEQVASYLDSIEKSVSEYMNVIDVESLSAAKKLILDVQARGGRVHVTGIGKPGHVAGYAASLFSSTGTPTYELHGTECVHGSAGQTKPGDVVIAISNSGETSELKATVSCLQKIGVHIIALTGKATSWLAQHADVALIAGVKQEGDSMNKPPRASILVELIALQTLSILLQNEYELTPEQYVKWHPGGALGASILNA